FDEEAAEVDEAGDVDGDLGAQPLWVFPVERDVRGETGVVDQAGDGEDALGQGGIKRCCDAGDGQVHGDRSRGDPVGRVEVAGGSARASRSSRSSRRATSTTSEPRAASCRANSTPMPALAPVMSVV